MSEAELLSLVRSACKALSVAVYHTHRSDKSEPGWPDLALVGKRVAFRELKTAKGKTSRMQDYWLMLLRRAGVDADVWRPEDWPDRIIAELKALGTAPAPPPPSQAELRARLQKRLKKHPVSQ